MVAMELDDILMTHADALARGEDYTEQLLDRYPGQRRQLLPLLSLARLLRSALVPVEPPADFVAALAAELAIYDGTPASATPAVQRYGIIGAAAVGTLLSVAGVAYWLYRRVGSHDQALSAAG